MNLNPNDPIPEIDPFTQVVYRVLNDMLRETFGDNYSLTFSLTPEGDRYRIGISTLVVSEQFVDAKFMTGLQREELAKVLNVRVADGMKEIQTILDNEGERIEKLVT